MAKLKILSGKDAGKEFVIEQLVVNIGREISNDIVLDDAAVSRRHAQICRREDKYEIIDEGSSNGTFVNGRQISRCELKTDDVIKFADVELNFYAENTAAGSAVEKKETVQPVQESKAVFVKFSVGSAGEMQKLQRLQDAFGSFLMGMTVTKNQLLNFKNISLEAAEVKPDCGGTIDSATEIDIVLAETKSAQGKFSGRLKPKFELPSKSEVVAEFEKADPLKRLLACLIDAAIVILLAVISRIIAAILPILGILIFVPPAYFLLRDGIFKQFPGQSLGKKAVRIMVVNIETKQPVNWAGSLVRQIFMLIPILNFIECIMLLVDRDGRRIGDKAAKTMVIKGQ